MIVRLLHFLQKPAREICVLYISSLNQTLPHPVLNINIIISTIVITHCGVLDFNVTSLQELLLQF